MAPDTKTTHTPGPWTVTFAETTHWKDSPICRDSCGRGEVPIRIEQDSAANAARAGGPGERELHVLREEYVEAVIAADGTHVVHLDHDDGFDGGPVSPEDARLIAAAPELLAALHDASKTITALLGNGATKDNWWATMPTGQRIKAAIAKAEGPREEDEDAGVTMWQLRHQRKGLLLLVPCRTGAHRHDACWIFQQDVDAVERYALPPVSFPSRKKVVRYVEWLVRELPEYAGQAEQFVVEAFGTRLTH